MTTFVCWKWRQPNYRTTYTAEHVNVWAAMLRRHYRAPSRLICVTDDPRGVTGCETFPMWSECDGLVNPSGPHLPSCYRRLKIFDPRVTSEMDIDDGAPVTSIDLDVVFVADLQPVVDKFPDAPFVGWRGVGARNPVVYNGSIFRFRAGRAPFLWHDFNPERSPLEANKAHYFGSDQGWISYRLKGSAPGWGVLDGVLSYSSNLSQQRGIHNRRVLPGHARIVSFNGKRKPWEAAVQQASPWIGKHWHQKESDL